MKFTIISVATLIAFFGAAYFLTSTNQSSGNSAAVADSAGNVSMIDGTQIVEITAKGGYQPKVSVAKAGVPTKIRFDTNGTFDCSSGVRIPSLGISRSLPQAGVTDINIGTPQMASLSGTCSMGMYRFQIDFKG